MFYVGNYIYIYKTTSKFICVRGIVFCSIPPLTCKHTFLDWNTRSQRCVYESKTVLHHLIGITSLLTNNSLYCKEISINFIGDLLLMSCPYTRTCHIYECMCPKFPALNYHLLSLSAICLVFREKCIYLSRSTICYLYARVLLKSLQRRIVLSFFKVENYQIILNFKKNIESNMKLTSHI